MFLIDYEARRQFLLTAAPVDQLLADVGPLFRKWIEGAEPIIRYMSCTNGTISTVDPSQEATQLRQAIEVWKAGHGFLDDWTAAAAGCTLFAHMLGRDGKRARPGEWYVPQEQLHQLRVTIPFDADESQEEYLARFDAACRARRKEFVRLHRQANTDYAERAQWTAALFAGATFADIARDFNVQLGEDAVRKAIISFAERATLTLPVASKFTVVERG